MSFKIKPKIRQFWCLINYFNGHYIAKLDLTVLMKLKASKRQWQLYYACIIQVDMKISWWRSWSQVALPTYCSDETLERFLKSAKHSDQTTGAPFIKIYVIEK